jgi:hypothetical protein
MQRTRLLQKVYAGEAHNCVLGAGAKDKNPEIRLHFTD